MLPGRRRCLPFLEPGRVCACAPCAPGARALGISPSSQGTGDSLGCFGRRLGLLAAHALLAEDPAPHRGVRAPSDGEWGTVANRTMKQDKSGHAAEPRLLAAANGDGRVKRAEIPKKAYQRELLRLQEG